MYLNPNVGKKERKRLVLTEFRGVDAASPVYKVDPYRASGMVNFISKNGHNHKRPGWRQIGLVDGEIINGYFKFVIAHQEIQMLYTYSTTDGYGKFYYYKDGEFKRITTTMPNPSGITNNLDNTKLKNRPAYMFINDNKAYFIGMGDFLVFGVYEGAELRLQRVYNDSKTYIPVTTMNISSIETDYDDKAQAIEKVERVTRNDVNVLTYRRKNELIGSDYYINTDQTDAYYDSIPANLPVTRTYKLDGENLVSGIFNAIAKNYVTDDQDDDYGKSIEYKLSLGNAESPATTTRRNPIANDIGTSLAGKTVYFDTEVSSLKQIGEIDALNSRIKILNAENFSIYGTKQYVDSDDYNAVLIYYKDGSNAAVQIATATRLNENENYSIQWNNGVSEYTITAADADLEFISCVDKNKLNIAISGLSARRYYIVNSKGTDASPRTYTVDERTWGIIDFDKGEIEFQVHAHTISGESNIEVEFAEDNGDYADRILDCHFGTLFGASGQANALFVAGNGKYPNVDYWSSSVDFTYFPSENYCAVGTSNSKIMGYQRLGDTSLAILKEDCHGSEPTLYVRTGVPTTIEEETVNGQTVQTAKKGYYLTSGKYVTQGAIAENVVGMLNGDALFLSRYGVYGIQINSDSIAVEQRVAKERSRLINPLLMKHADLSFAKSIVYKDKFYIALDGEMYIADARFVFSQKGDMADTYNYDWWVWDNCPVNRFFIIDDELCFGTTDGRICVFDDLFIDRYYYAFKNTPSFDIANNRIQVSNADAQLIQDDDFVFFKGNLFRLLFAESDMTINYTTYKIAVGNEKAKKLYTGQKVYLDKISSPSADVQPNTAYLISDIDLANGTFKLTKEDGSYFNFAGTFRVLASLHNEVMKISETEIDGGGSYVSFKNRYTSEEYVLTAYHTEYENNEWTLESIVATPYRYYEKNVVAKWITPVMDMGANDYIKTLTRFTLAAEQIKDGKISLGFETKNLSGMKEIDAKGLDVFDFSNLDFGNFTFDTGFESSFTKAMKASFNFIVFKFESDNPCDCCVHSLTIEYKVNHLNKGVW